MFKLKGKRRAKSVKLLEIELNGWIHIMNILSFNYSSLCNCAEEDYFTRTKNFRLCSRRRHQLVTAMRPLLRFFDAYLKPSNFTRRAEDDDVVNHTRLRRPRESTRSYTYLSAARRIIIIPSGACKSIAIPAIDVDDRIKECSVLACWGSKCSPGTHDTIEQPTGIKTK